MQEHVHNVGILGPIALGSGGVSVMREYNSQERQNTYGVIIGRKGNTTHGKQKGVKYIIKVL